ncbi:phosphodiester glycosidase family protein [Pseudoduganella aquatica]|uniref:Metallophosphoesterase n=1 Tax=Pseudoduganella aquatica TaxID=2660641 RepID=A0A7X4H8Q7_9BURK|nr:phosphodiester glycosidase family protein [Pseudoduganella aquatica]MYN06751.1 metallophosphoesterase [Pseudoduganella aquatica]
MKCFKPILLALALAACSSPHHGYVDQPGSDALATYVIAPPPGVDKLFASVPPPVIDGTTATETVKTAISGYQAYQINQDVQLFSGQLNHTKGAAINVLSFKTGDSSGVELVPIERSTGQFSMETVSASANRQIDKGVPVLAAVNADFFNTFNGWNVGMMKLNGVTYGGASPKAEGAVLVKNDGSIDIVDKLPDFSLRWTRNQGESGLVKEVSYFDRENARNNAVRQAGGTVSIYPGDNFRGAVDLRGKSAYLLAPEVNNVTVVANPDGKPLVQFAPFKGKLTAQAPQSAAYIVPSGSALLVLDGPAGTAPWKAGDEIAVDYQTTDAEWNNVKYALGAGSTPGSGAATAQLLVKDGKLADGAANEVLVSSRTMFGLRADGSAFLAVVDKPAGSPTDGVTFRKLGQIALAYGAVKAINLDGGGSSEIAMRAPGEKYTHAINQPSDGIERPVGNKWGLVIKGSKVRYPNGVNVMPRDVTLLAGSDYRFKAVGYNGDSYFSTPGSLSFGTSKATLGQVVAATGQFRASEVEDEGYMVAALGEDKGAARLRITKSPDTLIFDRSDVSLNGGEQLAVLPVMLKDGAPVQYSPSVLQYQLSTQGLGELDSKTGVFTAAKVFGKQLTITVRYGALSASTTVSIGVPPAIVEDFEAGAGTYAASGARQKSATLGLAGAESFAGKNSLKLSWVADPAQPGTFGAYLADPAKATTLKGYPKALGVNVFIPPALAGKNWWVRGQLRDADNKAVTIDYNNSGDALPQTGWTFMRAAIPEGFRAPFRFDQPFRFLVLNTPERIDSFVYLDNFTAIYSADTDLQGPAVQVTPANRATVNASAITIELQAQDVSGIDMTRLELKLDGVDIAAPISNNGRDAFKVALPGLADGWHKISYRTFDINGNVGAGESLFNVDTGATRFYVEDKIDTVYPSGRFDFPLKAVKGAPADSLTLTLQYDSTKASLEVVPADASPAGVTSRAGYWEGTFSNFKGDLSTLALIRLNVFDYVAGGAVSVVVGGTVNGKPYIAPVIRKDITGKYRVLTKLAQLGKPGTLQIVDSSGRPAAGVTVEQLEYNAASGAVSKQTRLGVTNDKGEIAYSPAAGTASAQVYFRVFDAAGSPGASLLSPVIVVPERLGAAPRYVRLSPAARQDAVNVSWMTATSARSNWIRYGESPALERVLDASETEVLPYFYGAESGVVRVSHASLPNLKPGTVYYYQAGNESAAGEVMSFRTDDRDDDVRLYLFGDTQTNTDGNIRDGAPLVSELYAKMQAQLPNPDLILHVGDMTDDGSDYQMQRQFFEALEGGGRMGSALFVPAQGNHEVYNEGRSKFQSLFRTPANGPLAADKQAIYSFDYGNMHIAVITTELFTDAEWKTMMDWLAADMQASSRTWRVLMMHRPAYEGNADSGNEFSRRFVPEAADRAGIDLVIAGHDHQYARSVPVTAGKPDGRGVTYLIAGSDSAKFYNASSRTGMPAIADVLYDDDIQTYTTLHVQGNRMNILTRNIYGKVIDQATLAPRKSR